MLNKVGDFKPDYTGLARASKIDPNEFYKDCRGRVSGIGAVILNGYSTQWLAGNVTFITDSKELDGFYTGYEKYIYIPNYDRETGYDCFFASPERLICDYLMYPKELNFYQGYWDLLEGYIDDDNTPDNFDKVYDMLGHFGIDRKVFDDTVDRLNNLEERC